MYIYSILCDTDLTEVHITMPMLDYMHLPPTASQQLVAMLVVFS